MNAVLMEDEKREQDDSDVEASDAIGLRVVQRTTYTVFSEAIDSPLLGSYVGYGIAATDAQGNTLKTVHDITCDRGALEALVDQCNRYELSLCHLDDVIEDFLC